MTDREEKTLIDGRTKGIPPGEAPFALAEIGGKGWNVLREDMVLPLAVLKSSALAHNGRWMRRFVDLTGTALAPHGKTTMSPDLFARQLADGAWGLTLATVQQVRVARTAGIGRIVLANQLVGRQAIDYVAAELAADPGFDFYCLVDSIEGVEQLAARLEARAPGRPLQVMVEVGAAGGRTGCRSDGMALAVAQAVKRAEPLLTLRGVEGYEGMVRGDGDRDGAIRAYLDRIAAVAAACEDKGLFGPGPVILSAGGSAFYDMVAERLGRVDLGRESMVLLRSGCYLTHDSSSYAALFEQVRQRMPEVDDLGPGPAAALEVWAYVQSRPQPDKAILTVGKRDISHDAGMPVPALWFRPGRHGHPAAMASGAVVTELNDQHAHLSIPPESDLEVGDMVALGVSHPCTTFDKWRVLYVVDDRYDVVSAVATWF
ncbi:amino acid deaminase [Skermanella mucosa]|uniref:amino acid deaminase n=1 Tax=Skermanella mucosa TaxID=1789672 RepID=UPI00192C2ADE|nr:amino acid deaminase [Skermanella mucosa]UEM23538.1 amino acid deaminase [Skermanella mucosa]